MRCLLLKLLFYLSVACVGYSCKSASPLVDIGKRDLYNDGLELKINETYSLSFKLDIKPAQIQKDTLYRKISSRAFDGNMLEDGALITGDLAIFPNANWDATLNEEGYIVTKQTFPSSTDDALFLYSYDYSFDNELLTKAVVRTKRDGQVVKEESFVYLIEYLPNGMIKQITVKDELDKLIIKREYQYKNRELIAVTTNGSNKVIEKRIYQFDQKGEYVTDINYLEASSFFRKSNITKETNGIVVIFWEVYDEQNAIVSKGYEKYAAGLLIEFYNQNVNKGEERHSVYTYNTKNDLAIVTDTFKNSRKVSTSITKYLHEYDNIRGTVKTTTVQYPDKSDNDVLNKAPYVSIVQKEYK